MFSGEFSKNDLVTLTKCKQTQQPISGVYFSLLLDTLQCTLVWKIFFWDLLELAKCLFKKMTVWKLFKVPKNGRRSLFIDKCYLNDPPLKWILSTRSHFRTIFQKFLLIKYFELMEMVLALWRSNRCPMQVVTKLLFILDLDSKYYI